MKKPQRKSPRPALDHIERCMVEQNFARIIEEVPRRGSQDDRWEYLERVHVDEAARAQRAKQLLGTPGDTAIAIVNTRTARVALALVPSTESEIDLSPGESPVVSSAAEKARIAANTLEKVRREASRIADAIEKNNVVSYEQVSACCTSPEDLKCLKNVLSTCRHAPFEYETPSGKMSFGGRNDFPRSLPGANKATVLTKVSGAGLLVKPNGEVTFAAREYELSVPSGHFPADFSTDLTVKLATVDDAMALWLLKTADTQFLSVRVLLGYEYLFTSQKFELRLEAILNQKEIVEHCRHPRELIEQYFGQSSLLEA